MFTKICAVWLAGVATLRGTLPWIAPEIIKTPSSVTESVVSHQAGDSVCLHKAVSHWRPATHFQHSLCHDLLCLRTCCWTRSSVMQEVRSFNNVSCEL
jgi:hypothetical protein